MNQILSQQNNVTLYHKTPKFVTQKIKKPKQVNNKLIGTPKQLSQYNQIIAPQYIQPNITNTTINNQSYQMIFPYPSQNFGYQGYQNYQTQAPIQYINNQNNQNLAPNNQILQKQNYTNNNSVIIQNNNKNNKQIENNNNEISVKKNLTQKEENNKILPKKKKIKFISKKLESNKIYV